MSTLAKERTGKGGIELSSLDWLLLHHRVKLPDRRAIVRDLDIRPGDRVLDLGCGPGLWSQLLADAVGPGGQVVGVDFDGELLDHAREATRTSHPEHDISFRQQTFEQLDDADDTYDVVFFSNCFCYVPDPSAILEDMKRVTRSGGRVIGRNWDGGVFILYPMAEQLLSLVQHHLAQATEAQVTNTYFDNYFGRKMPGLFRRHGFADVSCKTKVIERSGPADPELAAYIRSNGDWMADTVAGLVPDDRLAQWRTHFDPEHPACVYRSEDFYFCMIELAVTGYV